MTRLALLVLCLSAATASASPRDSSRTLSSTAVLTVGSFPTMNPRKPRFDYASALFVDSTRGLPETGYWKVPAGRITLLTDRDTIDLPGAHDIYSGVGYFAKDGDVRYAPGTTYTMVVSGSDSVGGLRAAVVAPRAPRILEPDTNAVVPRTTDLVLRWDPGVPSDSIQIDIQPHSPSGFPHLVYHVRDSGRFALPCDVLYDFPSEYATMITLTRSAETPVHAAGLRGGALRAQAADFTHIYLEKRRTPER